MFGTRSRKIIRDITARKTRTALVSLSIFVGVLGVVVLTTLGELIAHQLQKDLVPSEMAMLRIFVDLPPRTPVDNEAVLRTLRQFSGVTRVEAQAVYEFHWKRPGQQAFQTGQLYAYSEPFGQIRLEPIRLIAGSYPVEGNDEIAIEKRMADKYGLAIGDSLVVQANGGGQRTLRIVGLVFQPYFYLGGDDGTTSAYATYSEAQQIVGFSGYSSFYVRFTDYAATREKSYSFRKTLMDNTPYKIVFYLINDPQNNLFLLGVRQFARVLTILAVVAMVVACFLVVDVVSTIIAEQHAQIGAMKALGATRWDVLRMYLGMAFAYGLIGTVPAILVGIPLGRQAALVAAPVANTILETTSPPPLALILGILLGLGMPVLAAMVPVYHGSRITILDGISDWGIPATYGKGLLPTAVKLIHLPLPVAQALNNIFRHKARLSLTFFTLTLAVAAFMGVYAVFHTLNNVAVTLQDSLKYQLPVNRGGSDVASLVQSLLSEEQIREIQPGVAVQLSVEQDGSQTASSSDTSPGSQQSHIYVTGIDTSTDLLLIKLVDGEGWNGDPQRTGIVITQKMATDFGKTVGDSLRLVSPEHTADFKIIGIAEFPLETAFMEWHQLADFVGVIRDAPTPNAYWEQVQVQTKSGDSAFPDSTVWALGIDARVGQLLAPGFDVNHPGVIITQAVAQAGGYKRGDAITLAPPNTSLIDTLVESTAVSYPILAVVPVNVTELRLVAQNFPPDLDPNHPLIVAMYWSDLASLVKLDYRKISPETFYIDLANPQATANKLNPDYTAPVAVYQNQGAFEDRINQTLLSLGVVMGVAASLMAVVGGIGLLAITSIGVFERQREIGVMRSVGASSLIVLREFLLEGLLIGALAWVLGLPLSYLLSRLLVDSIPFSDAIAFRYTLLAPLIGLIGILFVTGAATLYPSIAAARKTVAQILRYQ
jgi:putative ABC transport system permease protein